MNYKKLADSVKNGYIQILNSIPPVTISPSLVYEKFLKKHEINHDNLDEDQRMFYMNLAFELECIKKLEKNIKEIPCKK